MTRRAYGVAVALAVVMAGLSVIVAWALGLPLRDPDGTLGPSWVRLPALVLICFLADVLPRAWYRAGGVRGSAPHVKAVVRERWTRSRLRLIVVGLGSFYLTYVGYRNLKSFLPWIREQTYDAELAALDRMLMLGQDPAAVLHALLGTGFSAHVLSLIYVGYLLFVPASLAAWLVWSRNLAGGLWYCTALGINWTLGVVSYYLVPSFGPAFTEPSSYWALPDTGVSALQAELWFSRFVMLPDPHGSGAIYSIAGFASLHVSVVFTAALITHLTVRSRGARWGMWAFLGATVLATIYFGWHYIADDVAGLAIGAIAVWWGAVATGHDIRSSYRGQVFGSGEPEAAPAPAPVSTRRPDELQTV